MQFGDLLIIYPYKVNNVLSIVSNQDDLTVKAVRSQFRPTVSAYYTSLYNKFDDKDAKRIGKWFQTNYIVKQPLYSPTFCTVADSENGAANFPRTQNNVEAWYRRLKVVVGKRNSGLYKIINDLRKELILSKMQVEKVRSGEHIRKKKSSIKKSEQIRKIIKKK
jgi:hypothetical protein